MKFKLNVAGGQMEIEGKLKEIIKEANLLQSIPKVCPLCKGEIKFDFRSPKGFDYYALCCAKCGARKNFGVKKEDGSLFLRWDEKFEVFQKGAEQPASKEEIENFGEPF